MTDTTFKTLLLRNTIAGAVAREIRNMELNGHRDGLAYKAQWDRQLSPAEKHIDAAARDAAVMRCRA